MVAIRIFQNTTLHSRASENTLSTGVVIVRARRHDSQIRSNNQEFKQKRRNIFTQLHRQPTTRDNGHSRISELTSPPRRSSLLPYSFSNGWNPVTSHENLPSQPPAASQEPKSQTSSGRSRHKSMLSWPLPRHVTPSIPLSQLPVSRLSAITERSHTDLESKCSPNVNTIAELPTETTPKESAEALQMPSGGPLHHEQPDRPYRTQTMPNMYSRPRPLLPHRPSYDDDIRPSEKEIAQRYSSLISALKPSVGNRKLGNLQGDRVSMPRSISLISQSSGTAPADPAPPVPPPKPAIAKPDSQRRKSVRFSQSSYETTGSSILGNRSSQVFSQRDSDYASRDLLSPQTSVSLITDVSSREEPIYTWQSSGVTRMGSPPGKQTRRCLREKHKTSSSFRGTIEQTSLERRGSAGLYTTHLNNSTSQIPRRPATTTAASDQSRENWGNSYEDVFLMTPTPATLPPLQARHSISGSMSQRRLSQRLSILEPLEAKSFDNGYTNVLQNVSGNQVVPAQSQPQRRPATVATGNPFQWDPATQSRRNSALKGPTGQRKGHKRQNCVRISGMPILLGPNTFPPTAEEPEDLSHTPSPTQEADIPGLSLTVHSNHPLPRPPSLTTFNFEVSPTSPHQFSRESSPTLPSLPTYMFPQPNSQLNPPSPNENLPSYMSPTSGSNVSIPSLTAWPVAYPRPLNPARKGKNSERKDRSPIQSSPPSALKQLKEPSPPHTILNYPSLLQSSPPRYRQTRPRGKTTAEMPNPLLTAPAWNPYSNYKGSGIRGPREQPSTTNSRNNTYSPSLNSSTTTLPLSVAHLTSLTVNNSLPSRHKSTHQSRKTSHPYQRPSHKAHTKSLTSASPTRNDEDLRKSIIALRRMNSEATGTSDRHSNRYLRMGNRSPSISPGPSPSMLGFGAISTWGGGSNMGSMQRRILSPTQRELNSSNMSLWSDVSVRQMGLSASPSLTSSPERMRGVGVIGQERECLIGARAMASAPSTPIRRNTMGTGRVGLGLGLEGIPASVWGTPKSLYDSKGFLKE
ncbi:MAG: hypothetical protein M1834_004438 [Cirrosporium novae-zelandiae]|nr:MAG: hypothetical protein M1834_004438 [Cirrosporium novae-zelandiae]